MNALTLTRLLAAVASVVVTATLLVGPAYAMPAGEGSPTEPAAAPSTKTRAERKAETLQARRNGALLPPGVGMYKTYMSQNGAVSSSARTRAERKAETLEAAHKHQLMPAGEAAYPGRS
jgi:hypothetical protein